MGKICAHSFCTDDIVQRQFANVWIPAKTQACETRTPVQLHTDPPQARYCNVQEHQETMQQDSHSFRRSPSGCPMPPAAPGRTGPNLINLGRPKTIATCRTRSARRSKNTTPSRLRQTGPDRGGQGRHGKHSIDVHTTHPEELL